MDPDHPLAALVRKARQERNGTATEAPKPEEVTIPAASSTPAQYTADREYIFFFEKKEFMKTLIVFITCWVYIYLYLSRVALVFLPLSPVPYSSAITTAFFLRVLLAIENWHLTS